MLFGWVSLWFIIFLWLFLDPLWSLSYIVLCQSEGNRLSCICCISCLWWNTSLIVCWRGITVCRSNFRSDHSGHIQKWSRTQSFTFVLQSEHKSVLSHTEGPPADPMWPQAAELSPVCLINPHQHPTVWRKHWKNQPQLKVNLKSWKGDFREYLEDLIFGRWVSKSFNQLIEQLPMEKTFFCRDDID